MDERGDMISIWVTLPFWLCGIGAVVFPGAVLRFYRWFHGADNYYLQRTEPRHVRNAGLVWLVFMVAFTYGEWVR